MNWTPEDSLAAMDRAGVATAILSISTPGVSPAGSDPVWLARKCNDYAAELVRHKPGRFQYFGALPISSVSAAIAEADHALANGASGVGLLTNYGGKYLGDAQFQPLFKWLNDKHAIVYVHPTTAPCCVGLVPELADALIEFPMDTARTISSLLWSGTLSRNPNVRFIFSHGAGVLPMVSSRVSAMGLIRPDLAARVPEGPAAALRRIYVDTASVENRPAMAALREWLPQSQILFGTDYPWGDPSRALSGLAAAGLEPAFLESVRHANARELFGAL